MPPPGLQTRQLFDSERFPNVVVSTDGTVVASWGRDRYRVRRSEDGAIVGVRKSISSPPASTGAASRSTNGAKQSSSSWKTRILRSHRRRRWVRCACFEASIMAAAGIVSTPRFYPTATGMCPR